MNRLNMKWGRVESVILVSLLEHEDMCLLLDIHSVYIVYAILNLPLVTKLFWVIHESN